MVNIGRSNLTFCTVSTPLPSCRWARNNPSQRCAKRSQNSRSFLSCASAASFLHCWTWSWKKSDVSIIAITTTKAPLTGASMKQKRGNWAFVPTDQGKRQTNRGVPGECLERLTGDCRVENIQSRVGLPERRRLPSINHTSLWLGAWTPTLRTRTARSAACRCSSGEQLQRTISVPSFPASTVTGAALS